MPRLARASAQARPARPAPTMPMLGAVRGGVDARKRAIGVATEATAGAAPARPTLCSPLPPAAARRRIALVRARDALLCREPPLFTKTGNGQGTMDARKQR